MGAGGEARPDRATAILTSLCKVFEGRDPTVVVASTILDAVLVGLGNKVNDALIWSVGSGREIRG